VGLRADEKGNLWGVENGMDDLNRTDLGGDIHNENPGEELVCEMERKRMIKSGKDSTLFGFL
jgi:hypothetical protein